MRAPAFSLVLLLWGCLHARPASDEKVEATPARVERGAYLANTVLNCIGCHSDVDESRFALPPKEGTTPGAGGQCWDAASQFPGRLCAPNQTGDAQTGLGAWSDGEIMRAIREGIDREGRGLFPLMPYRDYAALSDEDARALVVYLRTLPGVQHAIPEKQLDFPVGLFIRMAPRPLEGPVPEPDRADAVAYGRYLGRSCVHCHTPVNGRGQMLEGRTLGGGQQFHFRSGGAVTSPNLTPDPTGLGAWTREQFIARFRSTAPPSTPIAAGRNTVMPWRALSNLTEDDLSALYAFLRAAPPVDNKVAPWR
jgi:mono/diheme cytochrome c family protein